MAKTQKFYTVKGIYCGFRSKPDKIVKGTFDELKKYFSYTFECGESWQHEKGNYKINTNPKSIKSFVSNLNKAEHNRCKDFQAWSYELVEETK